MFAIASPCVGWGCHPEHVSRVPRTWTDGHHTESTCGRVSGSPTCFESKQDRVQVSLSSQEAVNHHASSYDRLGTL